MCAFRISGNNSPQASFERSSDPFLGWSTNALKWLLGRVVTHIRVLTLGAISLIKIADGNNGLCENDWSFMSLFLANSSFGGISDEDMRSSWLRKSLHSWEGTPSRAWTWALSKSLRWNAGTLNLGLICLGLFPKCDSVFQSRLLDLSKQNSGHRRQ